MAGGRLLCNANELQLRDHPGVFVSGDLAHVEDADGEVLPGTAQVALPQRIMPWQATWLRSIAA